MGLITFLRRPQSILRNLRQMDRRLRIFADTDMLNNHDWHGSPALFLFGFGMVHSGRGSFRRPLSLRLAGAVDALRAGCRQRCHLGWFFDIFLVTSGSLCYLVQLRHRLLYRIFQLHIQFTTSRKIGEERENRIVSIEMIISDRVRRFDKIEQ